jgi:ATP-dependent Clp endopeptidase proteolytic subunit ClpP
MITIENRTGKLRLNDGVHKESADKLIDEIEKLYGNKAVAANMILGDIVCSAENALKEMEVEINTPGGSVFEGQRIYNTLRALSGRGVNVITTVNGLAASMGSVILMAGDERRMEKGSRVMIHEASTVAWGDARTLRKQADLLEGISAEIAGIYAERTGGDEKELRQLMLAETWMTADQAKSNGFIHAIIKDGKPEDAAQVDIRQASAESSHMSFLNRLTNPSTEESIERIAALEADITAQAAEFQAKLDAAEAALQEVATIQAENIELRAKAELVPTLEAKIVELEAANVINSEKIDAAAAQKLAAMGHGEPINLGNAAPTSITQTILDKFNELKGYEATAFYKANRKAILDAQSKL